MSDLEKLVEVSNHYGKAPDFVFAGGGNTSVKSASLLYIKPSGRTLGELQVEDFIAVDRKKVRKTLEKKYSTNPVKREEQVKQDLQDARLYFKPGWCGPRASVETALHEIIDHTFVVHTHPNLINGLTCGIKGKEVAAAIFGNEHIWVESTDPGYTLTNVLVKKLRAYQKKHSNKVPHIILLQNHGVFVSADTVEEIYAITRNLVTKIKKYIKQKTNVTQPLFDKNRLTIFSKEEISFLLNIISPTLRRCLRGNSRKIILFNDSPEVRMVVGSSNGRGVVTKGTFSPDHMVYCKEKPLWIESSSTRAETLERKVVSDLDKYIKTNNVEPKIVFIRGAGMLAIGDSYAEARISANAYSDFIKTAMHTSAFGGPRYMTKARVDFIESWEVEHYRRTLLSTTSQGRLHNRVAVVTGAGQGIGEGIARGLAKEGAHVVIADINTSTAEHVAEDLNSHYGLGTAAAVQVNVTNTRQIQKMVAKVVRLYGGLDILVNNAAILISGSTENLSDSQLETMTQVNYQGFFKIVRECAGILKRQSTPEFMSDILLISSKSGLQGSPANALYAGSKFGGIGLMQSFAYEFIEHGIKVNAICPGNYFEGPLWADPKNGLFVQYLRAGKVPEAETIDDVREFYMQKCLMKKGVTLADILKAVLYAVEQEYETGQAIPVTGGQIMLK
jgi:rhamnose utilization protein RhaD (predicted bifunctional aldolase and dehydrogenase)/NAD(P)-dependent dehydrogenase (short-subunit alcohol dehydrogenase family)